jgi:hypothetical protein
MCGRVRLSSDYSEIKIKLMFDAAAPVILWGADTPSDKLRQCARCTGRGGRGATLKHPTWGGTSIGFMPFPALGDA